jgi:hypothetical protein
MKGNDTKRQILLSYYESEEPINEINATRMKHKETDESSESGSESESESNE